MRDIIGTLADWQAAGERFALATVTSTSRSAPRPAGAALALHPDGRIVGSVSGGCVEGAVVEVATEVLRTGAPQRCRYGITDADAMAVGLTCGGTIEVLVRAVGEAPPLGDLRALVTADAPAALATVVEHADRPDLVGAAVVVGPDGTSGDLAGDDGDRTGLDAAVVRAARAAIAAGATGVRRLGGAGEELGLDVGVLVEVFTPRPRMIVVGAADHADAVVRIGRFLGFHVTVCDPRARFATEARFPDADLVVADWPHRVIEGADLDARAAICVLTHDPKVDVPALRAALTGSAGYVGAMGSRRTHADRVERLRATGLDAAALERLRSPIGLDLGGRTPEETAVAVAAELLQLRSGATGLPLRDLDGPLHAPSGLPSRT